MDQNSDNSRHRVINKELLLYIPLGNKNNKEPYLRETEYCRSYSLVRVCVGILDCV